MLTLFLSNGFVDEESGVFRVTETARGHLVAGSPYFIGPYFASMADRPVVRDMLGVLRDDAPARWASYAHEDDWHRAMEKPGFAEMFTAAMDCRGLYLGRALARAVPLDGRRHLLDVGGGSGVYSCCFLEANPGLRATVMEKPPVDQIAVAKLAGRGCADRAAVFAGDFFTTPFPEGCDAVLLSNVLHDWDVPEAREIVGRCAAALEPGGLLVVHDAILDADKRGPLPVAEYSALLMNVTRGRCYSVAELAGFLVEAGFGEPDHLPTAADRSALVARRG
jgi:SAM-dependent methyltransferase